MTETFAGISNCLLHSFLLPNGNHGCHIDESFLFSVHDFFSIWKTHSAEGKPSVAGALRVPLCGSALAPGLLHHFLFKRVWIRFAGVCGTISHSIFYFNINMELDSNK